MIELPEPKYDSYFSVEKALLRRRSIREYINNHLSLDELSQLLWAGQGITHKDGYRTAPSAGALYPLELYAIAGNVSGIEAGLYRYSPVRNALIIVSEGNVMFRFDEVMIDQNFVSDAPHVIVITAVFERTTEKYGVQGMKYVYIDTGLASENIHLQAV